MASFDESEKGKGLGRYLLLRMLWEMRKLGYKHVVISSSWNNPRAMLFYTNYGCRVTDTTYGLGKDTTTLSI